MQEAILPQPQLLQSCGVCRARNRRQNFRSVLRSDDASNAGRGNSSHRGTNDCAVLSLLPIKLAGTVEPVGHALVPAGSWRPTPHRARALSERSPDTLRE